MKGLVKVCFVGFVFDFLLCCEFCYVVKGLGLVKVFCVGYVFGFFVLFSVIDECWAMCV